VKTAFPTEFPTDFQQEGLSAGAPEEIRTPDPQIRSLVRAFDFIGRVVELGTIRKIFRAIGAAFLSFSTRSAKIEPACLDWLPHALRGFPKQRCRLSVGTPSRGPCGGFHGRGAERRRPRLSTESVLGSKPSEATITRGCIRFPAADCLREIRRRTTNMTASTLLGNIEGASDGHLAIRTDEDHRAALAEIEVQPRAPRKLINSMCCSHF
jgi:hypothetical protein